MNPSIEKLADSASKQVKLIIGLMSGTSLDGLDIALCEIHGSGMQTKVSLRQFVTKTYPNQIKKRLKNITSVPRASMEEVCLMHSWIGNYHGQMILEALQDWEVPSVKIDCIASHGQTIYHSPKIQHGQARMPNSTLQIGDGDHIARSTGILTISDFRQKHTAAGGEGAPMASFVDRILFTHETESRILLNIGGIANFTYLPAKHNSNKQAITTDTGPGNTLIDAAMREYYSKDFDTDGEVAQKGSVNSEVLKALKSHPYFKKSLPKTTGPEVFNLEWVNKQLKKAGLKPPTPEPLIATLTRLTAETIADAIRAILNNEDNTTIYGSGGGIHNPALLGSLQELLPDCKIQSVETLGINPDAKEAVLFAVLANEMLSGEGFPLDLNNSQSQKLNFGKISFPS